VARIRSINPCAPKDEDVMSLSLAARYVWAYLPCHADREGRLKDAPRTLKAEIMPEDSVDMNTILDELARARHIVRYEVDGRRFIQIRSFARHQSPHTREVPSMIPPPSGEAMPEHNLGSARPGEGKQESRPTASSPSIPDQGSGSGSLSPFSLPQDQTRAESEGRAVAIRPGPLTGHELRRLFGLVRSRALPSSMPWATPAVAGGKDSTMAALIEDDPTARPDVVPSMELLFKLAKDGKAGDKSAEIVNDGSFAFGSWCSKWTALRERLHGKAPVVTAAPAGPPSLPTTVDMRR
jgi:hypothetical protein